MAVFLRPKHIQHLHHPTRHLRGYLSYEKTGHTYDFKLKKQATVPNGLFLCILRAGAQGECWRSLSTHFIIQLGGFFGMIHVLTRHLAPELDRFRFCPGFWSMFILTGNWTFSEMF